VWENAIVGAVILEIRPVSGCAVGKGLFASFAVMKIPTHYPSIGGLNAWKNSNGIAMLIPVQDSGPALQVLTKYPGVTKAQEFEFGEEN